MYEDVKEYVLKKYTDGNKVKVHMTKVDYDNDVEYDTVCGVYVNDELEEVFELTNISNNGIDKLMSEIKELLSKNTLYLI